MRPRRTAADIGTRDGGIVGRDEQRPDRGVAHLEERLSQPRVVHQARGGGPGRAPHGLEREAEPADGREQGPAAPLAVGPDDRRQAGDGPHALTALAAAGHPESDPDVGGPRPTIEVREPLDVGARQPCDRGDAVGPESRKDLALEPLEAYRVALEVLPVREPVPHQHVHHAERERGVGADPGGDVPVGLGGGAAPARIDHDQLRASRARLLDLGPRVDGRRDQVGAPGDDQIGVRHGLRIGAAHRTARRLPRDVGTRVADGPRLKPRGAEGVEEGHGDPAVELPLVRAVAVAEDRERPVLPADGLPAIHQEVERLVPAHRPELGGSLRPRPAERSPHAIRRVHQLGLPAHLRAHEAGGERLVGIAFDADEAPLVDVGEDGAHVGAVVSAHRTDHRRHADRPPSAPRAGRGPVSAIDTRLSAEGWPL